MDENSGAVAPKGDAAPKDGAAGGEVKFSQSVKREIAMGSIEAPCCVQAAAYGVALFGKYFHTHGLETHTESVYIAQWAKAIFQQAGIAGKVYVRGGRGRSYEFSVKDPFEVEKALALFAHSGEETALRLNRENIQCEGCFAAFVAAAFLCCGTIIDPEKSYSLEFVASRYSLMRDFEALLRGHGFAPKRTGRKGANVVYFKQSEQIEDLLTTMGAPKSALEIMNLKVYKDFRNKANRITNCETANIDKIVSANGRILDAIRILRSRGVLESLPAPLCEAARLREENPDLSLAELAGLCKEPVSKSGLSHRFRNIEDRARRLEETRADEQEAVRWKN